MILVVIVVVLILFSYHYIKRQEENNKENFINHTKNQELIIHSLQIIDTLFNSYNIEYTIAYGTLLGAIRHWGIIPWDDDADINVFIKDYYNIIALKEKFATYGILLEADYKLIKLYLNSKKTVFIDIFINNSHNGKMSRCMEPFDMHCNVPDRREEHDWWWKWMDYPSNWIEKRVRVHFNDIMLWAPIESEKLLKYWYGENCLIECKSNPYDHNTGEYIPIKDLDCGILPKLQL